MLKLNTSTQFKKDYKTCIKRHYKMDLLQAVVDVLRVPDALPQKNRDHSLTGNYTGCHECHIQPDWILIYRQTDTELYLVATGTHSGEMGDYDLPAMQRRNEAQHNSPAAHHRAAGLLCCPIMRIFKWTFCVF